MSISILRKSISILCRLNLNPALTAGLTSVSMEEVHLFDSLPDDNSFRRRKVNKYYYRKYDPLQEHNEKEFRAKYRMTKESFRRLNDVVQPLLPDMLDNRGNASTPTTKLLIALRFYATGSFYYFNGEVVGYSASHVCTVVREVSAAIASLLPAYVKFPSPAEIDQVSHRLG